MPEEPQYWKERSGLRGKSVTLSKPKSYHNRTLYASYLTPAIVWGGRGAGKRNNSLKMGLVSSLRRTPHKSLSYLSDPFPFLWATTLPFPAHRVPWASCIPLSCPTRAPALLYPGRHPVFVWYCPYPTLLSTQGKAGQDGWRTGPRSGRSQEGKPKGFSTVWRGRRWASNFSLTDCLSPTPDPGQKGSDSQLWGMDSHTCASMLVFSGSQPSWVISLSSGTSGKACVLETDLHPAPHLRMSSTLPSSWAADKISGQERMKQRWQRPRVVCCTEGCL